MLDIDFLRNVFYEPPAHLVRSTHTDGHRPFASATRLRARLRPGRLAEAKTVDRFAIMIKLMPERHLKLLPGQGLPRRSLWRRRVAQAKNLYFLRMSVCVCG